MPRAFRGAARTLKARATSCRKSSAGSTSICCFLPIDTVYAFEPVPPSLTPAHATHILGAQAQLLSEYIETPKQMEYMAYPRLSALAEVVWSRKDRRDFAGFMRRLPAHLLRLDALDVGYRPLAPTAPR